MSLAALHGNYAALIEIPAPAEPADPPEPDDDPPEPNELPPAHAVSAVPTMSRAESATPVRCRRSRPNIMPRYSRPGRAPCNRPGSSVHDLDAGSGRPDIPTGAGRQPSAPASSAQKASSAAVTSSMIGTMSG